MENLKNGINASLPKKNEQVQQIVQSVEIVKLSLSGPQQNVAHAFCKKSLSCAAAITTFGNTILEDVKTTSSECRELENTIAATVKSFEDNEADWIGKPGGTSQSIADFFRKCTDSTATPGINKLTGLVIDLAGKGTPYNGIVINGVVRPILGMAVQIEKDRIYTARHVTQQALSDKSYRSLDIARLAYLPYGTTAQVIPLTGESSGSNGGDFDVDDVANDQIQLKLANSFDPGVKFAAIRKNTGSTLAAPSNIVIPSFFMVLAIAKENVAGKVTLTPSNWSNYVASDNRSSCKMITINDKCILHSCSTIGGVSGSPVFLKGDSASNILPTVIAVHRGMAIRNPENQCGVDSGGYLNTGAIPNFNLN